MTQKEFEEQYAALDEAEDEITDLLEADPENEELGRKYNELTQKRSDLERSFDGEETEEELGGDPTSQHESSVTEELQEPPAEPEDTQFRDDQGKFAQVPFQSTPEQKHREDLARRFPSMI